MIPDVRERLAGANARRLLEVVRTALGKPDAVLGEWEAAPVHKGASSSLYRLTGAARVGAAEYPWSVVLKVLEPMAGDHGPGHILYSQRELMLYRSGLLDDLPGGLRAPRCYGCDELEDGAVWLWLEHIREDGERAWPLARWALAARHLGQFNGCYLAGRPLPSDPWLRPSEAGGRLRTWLERHQPLVARIAAAPRNPDVRRFWPQPIVDALLRLWEERDVFCTALERLPQTFCHGDAIRRNLFARRGPGGSEETVAIDWEYAGPMAAGEEVGQTVSVAAAFFDVAPADLPALDEALFAGYLAGLGDAGAARNERQGGEERAVRFAYAAHAALRNAFNAVGATLPDEAARAACRQRYGHTWEELAEARAAVRPFLLDRAQEARRLMKSL
jgi:hypothetical protein